METNFTRNEKIIAGIAFGSIAVFFALFLKINKGSKESPQFDTGAAINYKMARPAPAYSEYTLDGRELDQTYEGLPEAARPKDKFGDQLNKRKLDLVAKQKVENKKKDDLKKKQTAAKAQAQNTTLNRTAAIAVADAKAKPSAVPIRNETSSAANNQPQAYIDNSAPAAEPAPQAQVPAKTPAKKTFVQWRNQIFSTPTPDTVAQFVAAFRKNEITTAEYQVMAQDLLDQSDSKLKGLGLLVLRSAPSLQSLSQLVHLEPAQFNQFQGYVDQSFNAYLHSQNVGFLNQALSTKDKKLQIKALALLNTNLPKINQGDFTGLIDPRNRHDNVTVFSMGNYRSLVPVLLQLGQSQDPDLASVAQQVAQLIQTANNLAQN